MGYNPNWPIVLDEVAFGQGYNGGLVQPGAAWTDLAHRSRSRQSMTSGRVYELAQNRTGTLTATWANQDGALNPLNTASPLAPGVLPYRPFRKRLQWPPSVNLLTADQATGGEGTPLTPGTLASVAGLWSDVDPNAQVAATAGAWQGSQVWQVAVPSGATAGKAILGITGLSIQAPVQGWTIPGAYSLSVMARCVTAGAAVHVYADVAATTPFGVVVQSQQTSTQTLTGSASAAWSYFAVPITVPPGATSATVSLTLASPAASAYTVQVDGWQWEPNPTPSGFQTPGTWYPAMTGWVERYPQTWAMSGTSGLVTPTIVDTFGFLSQVIMKDPLIEQVLLYEPSFLYTLGDGATAAQCVDTSGNLGPAPISQGPFGEGLLELGDQPSATDPQLAIGGYTGTVATISNPASHVGGVYNVDAPATYVDLGVSRPPGPDPSGVWTRMIAVAPSTTDDLSMVSGMLWFAGVGQGNFTSASQFEISLMPTGGGGGGGTAGCLQVFLRSAPGGGLIYYGDTPINDGNWHLITVGADDTIPWVRISIDGQLVVDLSNAGHGTSTATDCASDTLAAAFSWDGWDGSNYVGQMAIAAEFPTMLTADQIGELFAGFRAGFAGDSTGQRYQRILTWAGYNGPTALDAGSTTNMGPATDISLGSLNYGDQFGSISNGLDALSSLQLVVDTENGNHYIAPDGTVTFQGRSARYNQLTPVYVFGEDVDAGEYPYEAIAFDYDPTRLVTVAQINQYSTQQVYQWPAAGSPAQDAYGEFTLQRTVNSDDPNECLAAAQYLVGQFQDPMLRIESITLHPSAHPSLWPVCLSLKQGTRVRIMRRGPAPAPPIQFDGFVEQIKPTWDKADCTYVLQVSPADLTQYWLLAALHGSLHQQAAAAQPHMVCNPLPDAAVNPFAGSIPSGLQITVDPGTSIAETLTVLSVSATAPGYTSATVTFTTNLAHTHPAGAVWCEALPTGATDPTTWDPVSLLNDTTTLTY